MMAVAADEQSLKMRIMKKKATTFREAQAIQAWLTAAQAERPANSRARPATQTAVNGRLSRAGEEGSRMYEGRITFP